MKHTLILVLFFIFEASEGISALYWSSEGSSNSPWFSSNWIWTYCRRAEKKENRERAGKFLQNKCSSFSLHGISNQACSDCTYSFNHFQDIPWFFILLVYAVESVPLFFHQSFCSHSLSSFVCIHPFYFALILFSVPCGLYL